MNDELKYTTLATTFLRQLQESGEEFVFTSEASRVWGAGGGGAGNPPPPPPGGQEIPPRRPNRVRIAIRTPRRQQTARPPPPPGSQTPWLIPKNPLKTSAAK